MMILNWLYEIRSYLNSYSQYIRFRWLFPLIWAVALACLVWFYGEELSFGAWHPFASPAVRLATVIAIFAVYLVYLVSKLVRTRRADRKLIDAVTDGSADPARAAAEDVAELRARLRDALKTLRRTLGRGSIYRLPWYVMIGAPGAGKTTALTNSGLTFPLADATGAQPVRGVAGTRFCDWWFTDEAILIDTAGRYTSQEDAEADKAGWKGFLKLLRKHRPRQPLNGAIVTIGLDDIMKAEPASRLRQGRVIRQRLREFDTAFRLRVPAYLVLTKTDRLAGFSAFFEGLDRTSREQVWGTTLPLPQSGLEGSDLADRFRQALDSLVERLNALVLDRLQSETDVERRAEILAFPSQVALLIEPLHEMMGEIAAASRFDPPPRIRGLYFASAQQDEAPLDLMTRAAVADFGIELPPLASASAPGNKSFFLARLLRDVVFGEASLISTDPRRERRNRIIRWAGVAAIAVFALGLCGWWGLDYIRQEDQLAATEAHLTTYEPGAGAIPVKDVADRDFAKVAHLLDQAREIADPYAHVDFVRFGLPSQQDKVMSGYTELYTRALNDFLLPRLILQVEADLRDKPDQGLSVPDALRVYPMLGSRIRMEPDFAHRVLSEEMARLLPGDEKTELRSSLDRHIAALVAGSLTPIALDDELIKDALGNEHARKLFADWQAAGGAQCDAEVEGHYPFARRGALEMTAQSFKAMFGPGGAFDRFFKDKLLAEVDTSVTPWRWREASRVKAPGLDAFEQAAQIRQAFFTGADQSLGIAFDVTPISLDGGATSVVMTSEGQEVTYSQGVRGDMRPVALTWPGTLGMSGAEVDFQPAGLDATMTAPGFWALFRVLDSGALETLGDNRTRVTFRSSGRSAAFELRATSGGNPFDLAALRAFRCPRSF